ncbi:hypothetical protein [Kurthia sibirica]|uniref:YgiT-type zinc finger domain-containing protein n=1 Tax=Kurthia sibirica TaxID=202750 RepID=A0A2U3API8_9BACL|nr:hypothetical protein [Kurthia sibirica]PWI26451.1 hypothetical protein DEX24_03720 [Kurthia sibirica]GEK33018.1 hypothetical protein KSI01_05510 [Kurthia sibirica]
MICGKCNCTKKNVLTAQSYQLNSTVLTIQNIPASQCNCQLYINSAIEMEIQSYIDEHRASLEPIFVSFTDV